MPGHHWKLKAEPIQKRSNGSMGHSSIKVTFDVYGHLFEAHDDRRADRANAIANGLLYENPSKYVTNM